MDCPHKSGKSMVKLDLKMIVLYIVDFFFVRMFHLTQIQDDSLSLSIYTHIHIHTYTHTHISKHTVCFQEGYWQWWAYFTSRSLGPLYLEKSSWSSMALQSQCVAHHFSGRTSPTKIEAQIAPK
jgi:hypothetical protein